MRLALVALALASVAAVVVRRGRCDLCNGWLCAVNVAGVERAQ